MVRSRLSRRSCRAGTGSRSLVASCIVAVASALDEVAAASDLDEKPEGCYLGASRCCAASGALAPCCRRALESCEPASGRLLIVADSPAALGNAIIALHDAIILAKILGRALLLPHSLGQPPVIGLEHLSSTFEVDIVVRVSLDWAQSCPEDAARVPLVRESTAADSPLFDVPGGGRIGPFRDDHDGLRSGLLVLPHQTVDEPILGTEGLLEFTLSGGKSMSREGKWWTSRFPHRMLVVPWEVLLARGEFPQECLQVCGGDGGTCDGCDCNGRVGESGFLPEEWVKSGTFSNHPCLASILADERRPAATQQCLVVSRLFQSVHTGHHRQDHLLFFSNVRFADEVELAAAALQQHTSPLDGEGRLPWPYIALQLRTYYLDLEPSLNYSAVKGAVLADLQRAFGQVRERWPTENGPHFFIAADNTRHPLVSAVRWMAQRLGRGRAVVVTSDDTARRAGPLLHRHVALDIAVCRDAAAFIGSGRSTVSWLIAALRRTAVNGRRRDADGSGLELDLLNTFWPRALPPYLDSDAFACDATLPSVASVAQFWRRTHSILAALGDGAGSSSAERACSSDPELVQFGADLLRHGVFAGHRLHSSHVRGLWMRSLWTCAPLAVAAALVVLTYGLEGGHESDGFPAFSTREDGHKQEVYFMQRLWYFMWTRGLQWHDLAGGLVGDIFLELVSRRSGGELRR